MEIFDPYSESHRPLIDRNTAGEHADFSNVKDYQCGLTESEDKIWYTNPLHNRNSEKSFIPILYKDERYLIIDKPYDLKIDLPSKTAPEMTRIVPNVYDILMKVYKEKFKFIHQLDYATSGVLCLGRSRIDVKRASKLFIKRKVDKTYMAVVHGHLVAHNDTYKIQITRDDNHPIAMKATLEVVNSKEAVTEITTLKTGYIASIPVSLVQLKPLTGRTHQLRVTLSHIGHPIVGDWTYKSESIGFFNSFRMMLHAFSICIPLDVRPLIIHTSNPFGSLIHENKSDVL